MTTGKPVYVIADDLTGAADAANYFRTPTHSVRVSFNPNAPWLCSLAENVIQVFDSESRVLSEKQASLRLASAGAQLIERFGTDFFVFKKVDSTLRGHIGSEIEALLQATGRRIAVLAPSFPTNGRTVKDGKLLVNGILISKTPFARDPRNPVMQDKVSDIVRQTTQLPTIELPQHVIGQGPQAITQFLSDISQPEAIVVADAEADADLLNIATAVSGNPSILPCGSAGLAKPLASIWVNSTGETMASGPQTRRPHCEQVLIAVGSANPVSHQQLLHAAASFRSPIVELKPTRLARRDTYANEMERVQAELSNWQDERVLGVSLAKERAQRDPELLGSFENDMASAIKHWADTILANKGAIGFVATGGDTALALCKAMSADAIWPEGEVVSGMPWSWVETKHGKIPMISKAGGFGDDGALHEAACFFLGPNGAI